MRGGRNHRGFLAGLLAVAAAGPAVLMGAGIKAAGAATAGAAAAQPAGAGAGTVASLSFPPAPMAPAGTLAPGQAVAVTLTALDSSGAPVNDALVYLSLGSTAAAAGTASVAGVALTSTPEPFTTSQNGLVAIAYATADPQCSTSGVCIPAAYPTTGADQIQASSAGPSGAGGAGSSTAPATAQDSYSYASAAPAPDRYSFSPDPLAGPGSLQAGQSVPVILSVTQSSGAPEAQASVFISVTTTSGGGTPILTSTQCVQEQISTAPVACTTDANGEVALEYSVANPGPGSSLPTTGEDVITVQNRATAANESAADVYEYGAVSYQLSSTPMAPTGSLGSNQAQTVSITVTGPDGMPVADCPVYLFLAAKDQAAAGAAAATGATPSQANPTGAPTLGTSPAPFDTDADGVILVTYSAPPDLPASGMDVLVAQNRASGSDVAVFDPYSFSAPEFSFSPDPLAPGAYLGAGQSVTTSLSVSASAPAVYLSFDPAPGGGSASVGGVALDSAPTAFSPGPGGGLSLTYQAPASLPRSGVDRIVVQDAASAPAGAASDLYSFSPGPAGGSGSGSGPGYWLVASDGGVFSFGDARFFGSTGAIHLAAPVVGMAATPDGGGYWLVASDGGVFSFGDARFFGSTGAIHLAAAIVGMAATPDGGGYWLVASDGGVFSFGDARFQGSEGGAHLPGAIVGMAATPDGGGYWLAGADGSVYSFGDAPARGGANGTGLAAPVVGISPTATGLGYWLLAADGGVFSFGDAAWYGSTGGQRLNAPVRAMAVTANAAGYWLIARDGGVFAFGNATYEGSEGGKRLNSPVVGAATT